MCNNSVAREPTLRAEKNKAIRSDTLVGFRKTKHVFNFQRSILYPPLFRFDRSRFELFAQRADYIFISFVHPVGIITDRLALFYPRFKRPSVRVFLFLSLALSLSRSGFVADCGYKRHSFIARGGQAS